MTTYESLQGISAYPVPNRTLVTIMTRRGVTPETVVTQSVLVSAGFRLAKADVLFWLSQAPDIAQGGQSYSFTDKQRQEMRDEAMGIYEELDEEDDTMKTKFGYKGDRL